MKRLAIITTHPIQYNAPLFKMLSQRRYLDVKVFYTWGEGCMKEKFDPGFNKIVDWDISLLDGYSFEWVKNTSKQPGSHHYSGIINPQIIQQVNRYKPDALLIYGWNFQSHLKLLKYFHKKVNIFFRGDSTLLDDVGFLKQMLRQFVLRWIYTHTDKALYVGIENKKYFLKYGLKESQLIFAPHAVDNSRFNFTTADAEKAADYKKMLGIEGDSVVFLFAGKLQTKKAPHLLLKAFENIQHAAHLIIAGSGELEQELKHQAKSMRNVHFVGFKNQSEMPFIYQMCDVFVLPSSGPGETWGLAVNEAMAAGKAIIVSDKCGCAADLVKSGVNGYVVLNNSIEDLKEKLSLLLNKPEILQMGIESKKIIEQYSFEKICEAIERNV